MTSASVRRRLRRPRLLIAASAVCGAFGLGVIATALPSAAEQKPGLLVRQVDATSSAAVVTVSAPKGGGTVDYSVADGPSGSQKLTPATFRDDVVVVLDTSRATGNRRIQEMKAAANKFSPGNPGINRAGLVTTGAGPLVAVDLTDSKEAWSTDSKPVGMAPKDGSALAAGLTLATAQLATSDVPRDIVVLQAGGVTLSADDDAAIRRDLRTTESRLFVINVDGDTAATSPLSSVVNDLGGRFIATSESGIGASADSVADNIAHQFTFAVPLKDVTSRRNLTLRFGGVDTTISVQPGGLLNTPQELAPMTTAPPTWTDRLVGPATKWVVVALALLGAGGLAWAALSIVVRESNTVRDRLAAYSLDHEAAPAEEKEELNIGNSELLRRAVATSSDFADQRGMTERIELALERADVKLHAGEVIVLSALAPVAVAVFTYLLFGNPILALLGAIVGAFLPKLIIGRKAKKRLRQFDNQLPDALQLLAGTLRAGFSISQAIAAVADEVEDPMGGELRRVVAEAQLGRKMEDALASAAERLDSQDFRWTVLAIKIQREVGGNLSELLTTVADTMVQRQRLLRDVRALTAEGRMSAWVLGALPIGLIGFMAVANPDYLHPLTYGAGLVISIVMAVMMGLGFLWMNKIITIEV